MGLELFTRLRRKLVEQIFFRQHLLERLVMVHHPISATLSSVKPSLIVTIPCSSVRSTASFLAYVLDVMGFKGLLGAVQQDSEVITVNPEISANVIFISFIEKYFL